MEVPTRRLTAALSDGTGRYPEEIALVATGLLVVAGVVVALRVVDLVNGSGRPREPVAAGTFGTDQHDEGGPTVPGVGPTGRLRQPRNEPMEDLSCPRP